MMVHTKDLIELVKKRPVLWDRHCKLYRSKLAKAEAWLEIYKEIEPSYDELKPAMRNEIAALISKKWNNVRDSYVKSKKQSSLKRSKPYCYSEFLSFLDPIHSGVETILEEPNEEEDMFAFEESNAVYLDTDEPEEPDTKRPKLESQRNNEEENVVTILANLIEKEEDDDRAFFKSITPAVKSLTEDSKLEFRIEVMNLIKNLKEKDKNINIMKVETRTESDSDDLIY